MRYSSIRFKYNGLWSDEINSKIKNVSINNDFYANSVFGSREIIEDKIQGRNEPYLYTVDSAPLSFKMRIAFDDYATREEVNTILRWLYSPKVYKELLFTNETDSGNISFDQVRYFAIFNGEPVFNYVGKDESGTEKYIGYIDLSARCNSNTGFTALVETAPVAVSNQTESITTGADLEFFPNIEITSTSTTIGSTTNIILTNNLNDTTFTYNLEYGENVTLNGKTKILKTNLDKNPYESWEKDYMILGPGQNDIVFSGSDAEVVFEFRAPKFM